DAGELEDVGDGRRAADRDAGFRGGAAHVEGEDPIDALDTGAIDRAEHAAGGAGLEGPDGVECRDPGLGGAAMRHHDVEPSIDVEPGEPPAEYLEIVFDDRLDIGVGDDRRHPLVLADFARDLRRQRIAAPGRSAAENLGGRALMDAVDAGMKKAD